MLPTSKIGISLVAWLTICCIAATAQGQGITITGVGPVNRSMGGAGTAAPLESIGALHWNPASISALPTSEMSFGVELISINVDLSSTIFGSTNTTEGDAGFSPIPSVGWVHHIEDTPLTVGLGVFGVAGFKNNLPQNVANPLSAAGPAYADAEFLQLVPTLSYAFSERLSIGVAPTVMLGSLTLNPLGPSVLTPAPLPGSGNRTHWGGGFQIGAYYIANDYWRFGFTFKSEQWFETFNFFAPGGTARLDLDYPMILSLGTAFTGLEDWVIAVDARYFDYENADGFREFGFSSVFAFAIGAQYKMNEWLHLRAGYNVNGDPIHNDDVFANILTPLIQKHNFACGASLRLACNVDLNAAYVYALDNTVSGPLPVAIAGPGQTISNRAEAHSGIVGVTVRY
jgi:long-chain fatty acid transport protein